MRSLPAIRILPLLIVLSAPLAAADLHPLAPEINKLLRKVGHQRKLWPRRRVKVMLADSKGLATLFRQQQPPMPSARWLASYRRLGLWPENSSHREVLAVVAGHLPRILYDPATDRLHAQKALDLEKDRFALVHQLCVTLLHRRLRLARYLRRGRLTTDQRLARSGLTQADCTGLALERTVLEPRGADLGSGGSAIRELLQQLAAANPLPPHTPRYLKRTIRFGHEVGLPFVQLRRRYRSWGHISSYYRSPPKATSELIHQRRIRLTRIRSRKLRSLEAFRVNFRDTIGELQWSILLASALSRDNAARAAAGWRGDTLVGYGPIEEATDKEAPSKKSASKKATGKKATRIRAAPNKGEPSAWQQTVVITLSHWQNALEAKEFSHALARVARTQGIFDPTLSTASRRVYQLPQRRVAMLRRFRDTVLWIVGLPAAKLDNVEREVRRRWTVNGRRMRPH